MSVPIREGEPLYPRSPETVAVYNERVGAEVLSWHAFRHGIANGTKTRSGQRLRIPVVRYGRRVFTSLEAIDRWAQAVARADRAGDALVREER